MTLARSKITAQGQLSVPAKVRQMLGVGPGYTSEDIHAALFPDGPPKRRSLEGSKDGVRRHLREKHQLR